MRGFPAWLTHRTYHLLKLPTMNRRLCVVSDWTLALLFRREVVSLDVSNTRARTFGPRCVRVPADRVGGQRAPMRVQLRPADWPPGWPAWRRRTCRDLRRPERRDSLAGW